MDRKNIQGTSEWLENRKNHIGASDAPVVMGVSPWDTPYKLWENKLGRRITALAIIAQPAPLFARRRICYHLSTNDRGSGGFVNQQQ